MGSKSLFSKVLAVVAVAGVAGSAVEAEASKARVGSLQGYIGLVDTQTIFTQPAYIGKLGHYVTYEFGSGALGSVPKGEGGFLLSSDGARWGAYLGHESARQAALRGTFEKQHNPIDFFYGQDNWAVNVSLSMSNNEITDAKQTSLAARFGMVNDGNEFYVGVEALQSAETAGAKFNGGPAIDAGYLHRMSETLVLEGKVSYAMAELEPAGGGAKTETKDLGVSVGFNHRPVEGLYYGAGIAYSNNDVADKGNNTLSIPFVVGLEKDILSWMTVRGSVSQGILFGSTKNEQVAAPNDKTVTNANDTMVAAGLGIKHNGFTIDGTLAAAANGQLNGNAFLANAALTYNF
ncbi:MAG: hypothetical protein RBT63_03465 [Bdellovibrionales bacterium]|jgi:hypothetical protein|nr:hypothetical protein [Bdellovibrionales bacterium]